MAYWSWPRRPPRSGPSAHRRGRARVVDSRSGPSPVAVRLCISPEGIVPKRACRQQTAGQPRQRKGRTGWRTPFAPSHALPPGHGLDRSQHMSRLTRRRLHRGSLVHVPGSDRQATELREIRRSDARPGCVGGRSRAERRVTAGRTSGRDVQSGRKAVLIDHLLHTRARPGNNTAKGMTFAPLSTGGGPVGADDATVDQLQRPW